MRHDAWNDLAPRLRIGACVQTDTLYEHLASLSSDQGWNLERLNANELDRPTGNWDVIVLGGTTIDAQILALTATAARRPHRRVIVIAADRDPQHVADVLRAGGDDYLPVPYAPEECAARIRSLVARSSGARDRRRHQPLTFDFATRAIHAGPRTFTCSQQEWQLLIHLLEAEGRPVRLAALSVVVWGTPHHTTEAARVLDALRERLVSCEFRAVEISGTRTTGYLARFRRASDVLSNT